MRRLLVNDQLTCIPGTRTFWHSLKKWFGMEFVGGDYATLAKNAEQAIQPNGQSLIVRNASYFPPIMTDSVYASSFVPTISVLQDIFTEGPAREMQEAVIHSSTVVVFNSEFTKSKYKAINGRVIPLPVDFSVFEPGNRMGLQQFLSLPDGCVCWVGACQEAGPVKGYDIFIGIVRANPDLNFVAVFKDAIPESHPPNMRCYVKLAQDELAKAMGACVVGLCTSRMESQHLAGIEMGACGLPMVAPPVGVYFNRSDTSALVVSEPSVAAFSSAIRSVRAMPGDPDKIRAYWHSEFSEAVVFSAWNTLIKEVECSGQS